MTRISADLRRLVTERANGCCEYCRVGQNDRPIMFAIDHIIAEKHGGRTTADNLCLSCYRCNSYKGSDLTSIDWGGSQSITPLFNPRQDRWDAHFSLNDAVILPQTPQARVTVTLLRLNEPTRLMERELLLALAVYPCL